MPYGATGGQEWRPGPQSPVDPDAPRRDQDESEDPDRGFRRPEGDDRG
ncbi:hypothetical protein G7070_11940 [Propioniciclava coleopterorum]|uniref:Uncharacterized protein n=1 Tax=Propioniciclava coleopterorum TaxID=2714937 RepID=A0A6G7Y892_9ACTN|nr:hypothetical protein [Propioniciclava coleopterorum]QIK72851.1 hypothetical protein G7070_11940 [Propioniciclava coleopterorum]